MRVALVHDWLTGMRGGEKVLEVLCELYPGADLFTLFHRPGSVSPLIEDRRIVTSFVQRLPAAARHYRRYLPLFPRAIEQMDLRGYDLVISSSHCVAKSVITAPGTRHLCYCHSPMRYAWDQFDAYFGPARVGPFVSRWFYRPVLARLARWDAATAVRPQRFIANSRHVAVRIRRYYNREATIVHPPVDTEFYTPALPGDGTAGRATAPDAHLLIVSALVPYKRVDLAIAASARAGLPLRIVGEGPERASLERQAGPTVTFLGHVSDAAIREEYRGARAVLLPGEEDFGIVPVEAQACGRPVVALGRGGASETVVHGETGLLFDDPSVESLAGALRQLERTTFESAAIRRQAERFSRTHHVERLRAVIDDTVGAPADTRW